MTEKQEPSQSIIKAEGDTYEQSGNLGIGNMDGGTIEERAKVAGVMNENCNFETVINYAPTSEQPSSYPQSFINREQEKFIQKLGVVISEDHKYNGELVCFELEFLGEKEITTNNNILVKVSIAFNRIDEKIPCISFFGLSKEVHVRFGINKGKLRLHFIKGAMSLGNRTSLEDIEKWQVTSTGVKEAPTWEFQVKSNHLVLQGSLHNQPLGIADLLDSDCAVDATFEISVLENDIVIDEPNDLWDNSTNPSKRETKKRAFIKRFLKPKLENYLSKVKWEYDSAIIP